MATIQELQAQLADLERQIAETTKREMADTIARIKAIMDTYGLTLADLSGAGERRRRPASGSRTSGPKVAPKYRDPVSGNEWTGRGIAPGWIKDKNRDDFLIR